MHTVPCDSTKLISILKLNLSNFKQFWLVSVFNTSSYNNLAQNSHYFDIKINKCYIAQF